LLVEVRTKSACQDIAPRAGKQRADDDSGKQKPLSHSCHCSHAKVKSHFSTRQVKQPRTAALRFDFFPCRDLVDSLISCWRARYRRSRGARSLVRPGSPNGYIFILLLQHFALRFLQQARLWCLPQHRLFFPAAAAFPPAAGGLARAAEEAAINIAAQTRLIATALTFLISRIS